MVKSLTVLHTFNNENWITIPYFEKGIEFQNEAKYIMRDLCSNLITVPVPDNVKIDFALKAPDTLLIPEGIQKGSMVLCEVTNKPEPDKMFVMVHKTHGTLITSLKLENESYSLDLGNKIKIDLNQENIHIIGKPKFVLNKLDN